MDTTSADRPRCVACQAESESQPLIRFEFRGGTHWICARHFPVLIHDPARLAGKLPGAENLTPSPHEH
jgi:hypothetical protein